MFVLQVLNDANEWELIALLFKNERAAVAYYMAHLSMFAGFEVTAMAKA